MTEERFAAAAPLTARAPEGALGLAPRPLFSQRTSRSVAVAVGIALVPWVTFVIGLIKKWL